MLTTEKLDSLKVKIIKSVKDDFDEVSGPSTTTHAFLSIDGTLFELGRFYEGPYMREEVGKRLEKVLALESILNGGVNDGR